VNAEGPLTGLGIVLTRPRTQSLALATALEAAGARVLCCPSLDIVPLAPEGPSAAALASLPAARFALFVSANAVLHGLAAARRLGPWPSGVTVAAVGEATAAALAEAGIAPVIVPSGRADSEALLALPPLQAVEGAPIIIFRGVGGREHLRTVLESRGARVAYVECYRRVRPETDPGETRTAIERGEIHAVHAMSAESVENFGQILGPGVALDAVALVVPHEAIGRSASRSRFGRVIVAGPGPRGLEDALVNLRKTA
jgi:uroporphyrinogen-III synthase